MLLASGMGLAAFDLTTAHAQGAGAPPAATEFGGARLPEIVVTAQRRGENLQRVPITVTALTAESLSAKGGTSSEDLTALVPGVVFNNSGGGGQVTIRGIGGTNSGVDSGNALYIDGVYQFASMSNVFDFNAIERIEILKGPQGTLFGRNSAGGLVHVITRDPSVEKSAVEAQVGYASYNTPSTNFYVNAPLSDTFAVNLAAFGWEQNEGWGRNVATGEDVHKGYAWGVRAKARWQSTDGRSDVTLAGTHTQTKPVAVAAADIAPGTRSILGQGPTGLYNLNSDAPEYQFYRQSTLALTVHHDLGLARLTSITAYDQLNNVLSTDGDHSPLPILPARITGEFRTKSQELHLASQADSRVQWLIGALYLHNTLPITIRVGAGGGSSTTVTESWAVFGQGTYPITDRTKVTVGLRYTDDELELESGPIRQTTSSKKPTWRLALDHQFTDNVLGYVSYARGYKSGLFNGTNPSVGPALPQRLDAYEIGLKSESFDNRLRLNISAFHYDFKLVQIQLFSPVNALAYISNAGDAEVNGVDLDVAAEPMRGLTLTAAATYLDSQFTNSPPGFACYAPGFAGGLASFPCALKGNNLPFAPEFTVTLGAEYRRDTNIGELLFSVVGTHNSGYHSSASNFDFVHVDEFERVNASVGWTSPDEHVHASLWAKNLLDDESFGSGETTVPFAAVVFPLAPRTIGVTFGVRY